MKKRRDTYSDEELIRGIRAGGREREKCCEGLFYMYAGFVYKGQRRFRLNEEEASDIYADAVIALSDHIMHETFRGESRVSTYLYRIFFNKCVDRVRKNTTNKIEWTYEFPLLRDESRNFLAVLMEKEEVELLKGQLDQLGEKCRKLILFADYWGYSPDEIAKRMGFGSGKSASSQKYKCMEKLRKLIQTKRGIQTE